MCKSLGYKSKDTTEDFCWKVVKVFSKWPVPRERYAATAVINSNGEMWSFGGELQDADRFGRILVTFSLEFW